MHISIFLSPYLQIPVEGGAAHAHVVDDGFNADGALGWWGTGKYELGRVNTTNTPLMTDLMPTESGGGGCARGGKNTY